MDEKLKKPETAREGRTLETALAQLEEVVAGMEGGELPLEKLISEFERGAELVNFCRVRLAEAEKRVEIVVKKMDGTEALEEIPAGEV